LTEARAEQVIQLNVLFLRADALGQQLASSLEILVLKWSSDDTGVHYPFTRNGRRVPATDHIARPATWGMGRATCGLAFWETGCQMCQIDGHRPHERGGGKTHGPQIVAEVGGEGEA
jgi:hypothetical protein